MTDREARECPHKKYLIHGELGNNKTVKILCSHCGVNILDHLKYVEHQVVMMRTCHTCSHSMISKDDGSIRCMVKKWLECGETNNMTFWEWDEGVE